MANDDNTDYGTRTDNGSDESSDVDSDAKPSAHRDLTIIHGSHRRAAELTDLARCLILQLPPHLQDDRYGDDQEVIPGACAAALVGNADGGDHPTAVVNGSRNRRRLQLDVLSAQPGDVDAVRVLIDRVTAALTPADGEIPELWTRPDIDHLAAVMTELGVRRHRSLHQLRLDLSAIATVDAANTISTRSFQRDRDLENLVVVNNRSFAKHPDQSSQTAADMERLINEPWFTADGLRVLDDPDGSGVMAGFCWTKIHPPGAYHPAVTANEEIGRSRLGEIFIVGLDPDFHGLGLGVPLVAAGLDWLRSHGLSEVLLYVEADNHPALRTYERLGFALNRIDTAWRRTD